MVRTLGKSVCRATKASLIAATTWSAACQLELGDLSVHPDEPPALDAAVGRADAGPPTSDAGAPLAEFRDEFERPDGPADGALWQDVGSGTPVIWNGELCVHPPQQVRSKFAPGAYGYVQFDLATRAGFEVHLEGDGENILLLRWYVDQTLGLSDGSLLYDALEEPRVYRLTLQIDYQAQRVRVQLDDRMPHDVPFESRMMQTQLHAVTLTNQHPPDVQLIGGTITSYPLYGIASCVDNLLVAESKPSSDPFATSKQPVACVPADGDGNAAGTLYDCMDRHCCDLYHRCFDDEECQSARLCMYECAEVGTVASCQSPCELSSLLAQEYATCLDTFCSADKRKAP